MDILNFLFDNPWYWLIAGTVLIVLETVAAGAYLIWIGIGMVVTGLFVALLPDLPLAAQITILIVSMLAAVLVGIRLQARIKKSTPSTLNAGLEQYIGQHVIAAQDFTTGNGRIKLHDSTYSAKSDAAIKAGERVIIVSVQNSVFNVKPD